MPIALSQDQDTIVLAFEERCTMDDATAVLPELREALAKVPNLRFDTNRAESLDTAAVQFALSAAQSCQHFHSHDDPFFTNALKRWGIPALTKQ